MSAKPVPSSVQLPAANPSAEAHGPPDGDHGAAGRGPDGDDGPDDGSLAGGATAQHQGELRLWLRLLTCTNLIEGEIRRRMHAEFAMTLPRFDLMAQIDRSGDGILLGELSRRMMVSNGNVTGLVERAAEDGLVKRVAEAGDRRAARVRLTHKGRVTFARMARAHADWLSELLRELSGEQQEALWTDLDRLKAALQHSLAVRPQG